MACLGGGLRSPSIHF